jgi:hypothetical protein
MKTSATILVLLALLACTPCMAQTLPAPTPSTSVTAAPVPTDTADFLATLSGGQGSAPSDLAPAPSFMTGCTSSSQCPAGQLCCYPCGIDGCTKMCITAVKRCPLFV